MASAIISLVILFQCQNADRHLIHAFAAFPTILFLGVASILLQASLAPPFSLRSFPGSGASGAITRLTVVPATIGGPSPAGQRAIP
jgi:hypothetical protein